MTDNSTGRICGSTKIEGQVPIPQVESCVKILTEFIIGSLTTMTPQRLTPGPTKRLPSWQDHLLKIILRTTRH